ncbi:MAG: hypothetical protein ACOCXI_14045 [Chloroflexota bacterium]
MKLRIVVVIGLLLLGACDSGQEPAVPTAAPVVSEGEWYTDAQKEAAGPGEEQVWLAAWFAGENAMPESISRWWTLLPDGGDERAEVLLALSVERLDDPPEEATSAFGDGLTVRDVTYEEGQVLLDLEGDSPGLHGHGSAGYIIGSEQLKAAAAFYFPDADTLCVAYDGQPTAIEAGGPTFLHDASGCPIPLR